ncbi:MAG: nucleotidyltransferase domain-containing protein, partial [Euryarchaeota archaeon]
MSDFCEITGMSIDDANKFQYIHSKMIEEYSPKDIDGKYFEKLENELSNSVKRILPHKSDSKQRESLTNHLSRTLGKKFKASEVKSFGSSVTGLNIKGGDLDLCFVIPDANQKNTIVNMAKVLRGQGMENVQPITNAKVPILKFKDPRSGIRTDISVNNTLALHNTELLRRYSKVDRKVSDFIRLVKYWAFHRNISNPFEGTLSSYAWTILALNYLIFEGIIPNLQDTEEKLFIEINGDEYDISMRSSEDIKLTKEMSLSAMICGFFEFYSNWDWSSDVISIRNSEKLSRENIDWEHEEPTSIDLLNLGKYDAKTGKHHLPIQDPFDIGHDLSRVLTANGELKILNEILRARTEIGNGLNWSKLCETVDPERLADLEPEDLFHDIRNLPIKDVENKKTIIQGEINALETKIKAFEQEKSTAIRLANAMKGIIEETSDIRSEHKSIHLGLKESSKEIRELKKERDLINSNIVIPLNYIEEQLAKVYKRLTNELNVRYIPSLEKEISDFSWFFELQEMHKKAKDAENLHNKYVEL